MRILFDAQPLVDQSAGVHHYTRGLLNALAKASGSKDEIVCHYFDWLGRGGFSTSLPTNNRIVYRTSRILHPKVLSVLRRLGFQIPFRLLIRTTGDVAIFPNFVALPTPPRTKNVVIVHDLCFLACPQFVQPANQRHLARFVPKSVHQADLVVTISCAVADEIVAKLGVDRDKIFVTPIPPPKAIAMATRVDTDAIKIPTTGYILFLGTLEPRKNYMALVDAFVALRPDQKQDLSLVLAGSVGWDAEASLARIKELQDQGENIVVCGAVSENQKAQLYSGALLFVLPSFYEGFGMPILEAMSYGVPVVLSDIPVFREVAGNAATYYDVNDAADLTRKISQSLSGESTDSNLSSLQKERVSHYSWQENAQGLLERLKEVLGG